MYQKDKNGGEISHVLCPYTCTAAAVINTPEQRVHLSPLVSVRGHSLFSKS